MKEDNMKFENVGKISSLNNLIGTTIHSIHLSACKVFLKFETNEGPVLWACEGDCCSETWIEHITKFGEKQLTVAKIEEISIGEVMPTRQECDQLYAIRITGEKNDINTYLIDKEYIYIEFRNSSNGYYGGNMRGIDKVHEEVEFKKIEEDF